MINPRFISENVAFSSMPYPEDIPRLAEEFGAFVVLVEDHELFYGLERLKELGLEVLHSPIPDFTAPSLEALLEILRWIGEKTREGKRVLIHCLGGSGRSGTVAVAWLMYSKGLPLREALYRVRSLRPTAVETPDQLNVLKMLEKFLKK